MASGRQAAIGRIPSAASRPIVTIEGLGHAGANLGLAAMFFIAAIPSGDHHFSRAADLIWSVGMVLTGAFCAFRPRPAAAMLDWRAMLSGLGAFVLPTLMSRSSFSTAGFAYHAALAFEFLGVAISQMARVYMGHSFGVLPANRGIVSKGPFRFVRHPVYLGWALLATGFCAAYPSSWNVMMLGACLALTLWRISLEEELLGADPQYRAYLACVRWRLAPGIY